MTFHSKRKRPAKGAKLAAKRHSTPRLAASIPDEDLALLTRLAARKGIPASQVIRDAIFAYLLPFRNNPTWDAEAE